MAGKSRQTGGAGFLAAFGFCILGGASILGGEFIGHLLPLEQTVARQEKESIAPEAATGFSAKDEVSAEDFMIVAAHPAAAQAGAEILAEGGNALDALIAAQAVLNLVEPQSSGIGGGGFLLYWDQEEQALSTYDGREVAPTGVDKNLFYDAEGKWNGFMSAVVGGRSVGVPGLLRMLEMARQRHGGLGLPRLLEPAIQLAEDGFPVSPRLHQLLSREEHMAPGTAAHGYFFGTGDAAPEPGVMIRNPAYAETLRIIAREGIDSFYTGEIARGIVDAVNGAPGNPGHMTLQDMRSYEAKQRENLCRPYRDHMVCGMPPPSSGGITVAQILGILEDSDLPDAEPGDIESLQLFGEAQRLAFADRNLYIADSDFVDVPMAGMVNRAYLQSRRLEMDLSDSPKEKASPGKPDMGNAMAPLGADQSLELPSTTHIVVVDAEGNAASMTSSIETGFGSRQMTGGFLLNNQLTDFSAKAADDSGNPIRNRIEPWKRPRSSMAPTMVFGPEGELKLILGSPGGSRIIGYVAKTIIALVDWDMSPQEAVSLPHFINRNGDYDLEAGTDIAGMAEELQERGYKVNIRGLNSGLHAIAIDDDGELTGGADPRREGIAIGEDNMFDDMRDAFSDLVPGGYPADD